VIWQFQPYLLLLIGAAVMAAAAGVMCWRRRGAPGARSFALLMGAVAWWAVLRALEGAAATYEAKLTFGKLTYLGIASVSPLWLMAALSYCGFDRWLTRRRLMLLWSIPIITILLALTNDWHGWLWSRVVPVSADTGGNLFYERGWWWYLALVFNYGALLSGSILLVRQALLMRRELRRQAVLLIIAVVIPWIANALNLLRIYPVPGFDLTPFALATTGVLMAWGVFRFQLFELTPLVRSAIIDDLRDAILVIDEQRRILDMNRAALQLAGLPRAPIGQSVTQVLEPWVKQFERYHDVYEAEDEVVFSRPTGETRYLELRIMPLRDRQGGIAGKIITARDVTDRHQADVQLRQLMRAVEQSPASVVVTDTTGRIEYVNPHFTQLTGYTLPEALGQKPNILKTGHTPREVYTELWHTIAAGSEWHGEFLNRKKNGELYWEDAHIGPVTDSDGRITHYVAVKEEITERKAAEANLQQLAAELRGVIDASRDGILMIALDACLSVINAVALRLLNLPGRPADWHGQSVARLLQVMRSTAPEAARAGMAELRQLQRTGDQQPRQREVQLLDRTLLWQLLPVQVGDQLMGWLLALRDLTEERMLEQMREDMRRTMIHDLRNPLTSIATSLDVLADEAETLQADQLKLLQIARRNSQRMMNLINEILDVNRLESGQMPLNLHTWLLAELVADVLQVQQVLAQDKDITLESCMPADLPPVHADESLIRRVLQNLIGNAIKFTPPGGRVTLTTDLTMLISARPIVLISVHDTGPGISPELQTRLFQKFVTGSHKGRGSGLGLAFCKLVVEAHDQQIWVDSMPGQGTIFTFTLPVAR
jgi:PAS domain S-box-containing protein